MMGIFQYFLTLYTALIKIIIGKLKPYSCQQKAEFASMYPMKNKLAKVHTLYLPLSSHVSFSQH